jgi:hypothetical protein
MIPLVTDAIACTGGPAANLIALKEGKILHQQTHLVRCQMQQRSGLLRRAARKPEPNAFVRQFASSKKAVVARRRHEA